MSLISPDSVDVQVKITSDTSLLVLFQGSNQRRWVYYKMLQMKTAKTDLDLMLFVDFYIKFVSRIVSKTKKKNMYGMSISKCINVTSIQSRALKDSCFFLGKEEMRHISSESRSKRRCRDSPLEEAVLKQLFSRMDGEKRWMSNIYCDAPEAISYSYDL